MLQNCNLKEMSHFLNPVIDYVLTIYTFFYIHSYIPMDLIYTVHSRTLPTPRSCLSHEWDVMVAFCFFFLFPFSFSLFQASRVCFSTPIYNTRSTSTCLTAQTPFCNPPPYAT
ncbi:hypothetical protein F4810DRAFT_109139 [Camillea tinctor]|nr:hypothetical protein F4810DRAFT_109139 [Camillea tinctor]